MARPACLYCGAALPAEAVAAAAASASSVTRSDPPPTTGAPRTLLVLDQSSADPARLGEALDLPPYESALRHRRGGYALEGIKEEEAAREEAARLRSAGIDVFLVPEALARAEPWLAVGGAREKDGLLLRGSSGSRHVSGPDLLLLVRGPIVREYQAPLERRRIHTTRLENGYRFHLHLRTSPEILEVDPGDFDFGGQAPLLGSSLLELSDWLEALALGVATDDDFRHLTPALGPGTTGAKGPLAAAGVLSRSASSRRNAKEASLHDNLRQFRFYSSWRGAIERARSKTA